MQQVGGSIGTSALSTIALTATASYLVAHHASPLAPAVAATHGYTRAFAVSAGLLGLGAIVAALLLPSRKRLAELRTAALATAAAGTPAPAGAPAPAPAPARAPVPAGAAAPHQAPQLMVPVVVVIPVALVCCSPVSWRVTRSAAEAEPAPVRS
jgi:hypothetical protein